MTKYQELKDSIFSLDGNKCMNIARKTCYGQFYSNTI